MADLIDKKETIRAWCKLTCGCEPEECYMTIERDGTEECNFVEFLSSRPEYDCTQCFYGKEMKMSEMWICDKDMHCVDCPRNDPNETCEHWVEVAPVKHGVWEVTPIYIKCLECGESFMLTPQNYCPNCGAKMSTSNNAHWIKQPNGEYKCSVCGDTTLVPLYECHTCGARMDEVER